MTTLLIAETAVAWGLTVQEVQSMVFWIEDNVPDGYKSKVFTQLLRRHRESRLRKRK